MTAELEAALGHAFANPDLLTRALTHRSTEEEGGDYERLEFLGDAVVQLAVTRKLFEDYPDMREGELAKLRAAVVSLDVLASAARTLGVGRHLHLGKGEEQTGGRDKGSILADAFEALVGALYLDAGFETATALVNNVLSHEIERRAASPGRRDYKTRLQEALAARGSLHEYRMEDEGPDHDKTFFAAVLVDAVVMGRGRGSSKKAAQQEAARQALEEIDRAGAS
jgi:ribonuclease-3